MNARRASAASLLLLLTLAAATTSHAQNEADAYPRWAAIPQIALSRLGSRWETDQEPTARLGPSSGPMFGLALQHRPAESRFAFELLGGFTPSDYSVELIADDENAKTRSGSIRLYRAHGSVLYRVRPNTSGYFVAGVGGIYYDPVEPIAVVGTEPYTADESQWMPAAHIGAGLDIQSGRHFIRVDGRVYGSRATQDVVSSFTGEFEARSVALDVLISVGYLVRF